MNAKETILEVIRNVPIAGKTYEEYVEALADKLTEEGYRKASEVAREIFEDIDKRLDDITIVMGVLDSLRTFHKTIEKVTATVDELKKKYIGEDTNVTTKMEDD